jgi:extradiol dioxygenase family protein
MENAPFHLAFTVNDLETTKTFYKDLLGCAVGRESSNWVDFNFCVSVILNGKSHLRTIIATLCTSIVFV